MDREKKVRRKMLEKRARRNPDFPVMPMTPELLFQEEFYHKYKKNHPDADFQTILGAALDEWMSMTAEEQAVYDEKNDQLWVVYNKALDEYIEQVERKEAEKNKASVLQQAALAV